MATYLVRRPQKITRTSGYTSDVVLNVPAQLVLLPAVVVEFGVFDQNGQSIFLKDSTITVSGQSITIPISPDDTKNKKGVYTWECSITQGGAVIQIGKGEFHLEDSRLRDSPME